MGKYEKRIGKIWDKFDGSDDELLEYAKSIILNPKNQRQYPNPYSQVSRS